MSLVWTTEKPTEPGWYWARIGHFHPVLDKGVKVLVFVSGNAPFLKVAKAVTEFGMDAEVSPGAVWQWAGPIPQPEEPTEGGGR